jgi:hypothetical protein
MQYARRNVARAGEDRLDRLRACLKIELGGDSGIAANMIIGWPAPLGSDRLGSLCFEKREERTDDDFRAWN